eukprot:4273095-Prymnesium_polylepis.1
MQRDFEHGTRAGILDDGVAAWLRVGRHHARGHPAEERLALVVAVSDAGRSIGPCEGTSWAELLRVRGPPVDAPSHRLPRGPVWTFTPRVRAARAAPSRDSAPQVGNNAQGDHAGHQEVRLYAREGELEQLVGPAPSIAEGRGRARPAV